MSRIAIIHFTVGDSPGGIERIISAQIAALVSAGHHVRVIVGAGSPVSGTETIVVPELLPSHAFARPQSLTSTTVGWLVDRLAVALTECDQCWVHNIFSVVLHPALTLALRQLVDRTPPRPWLAWCEDISSLSRFSEATGGISLPAWSPRQQNVHWITISQTRRAELAGEMGLSQRDITVISPPTDLLTWLDLDPETRRVLSRTGAPAAEVRVLTVAKLLPHKNLDRVVSVAAALRKVCRRPLLLMTGAPSAHQPQLSQRIRKQLDAEIEKLGLSGIVSIIAGAKGPAPSDRTVRELMLVCDVLFLPSLEEGYGLPISEAIAARLPVVCFDLPALREAGGPAARYLPLTASDGQIATALLRSADTPFNRRRQELWQSAEHFRRTVLQLAADHSR